MKPAIDLHRRRLMLASGAAGVAGFAPSSLAQSLPSKPLPPYADFKDPADLIVHSANTIETRRDAFGTSGVTPEDILFVRNNLSPERQLVANRDTWRIEIDGVMQPRAFTLAELKRIGLGTVCMVLQCSGNGRAFFDHKASGTQWSVGAAGSTLWSGVPVKTVVAELGGVREGMRYMTSTGGETTPPGIDPKTVMVERSVPWTAMEEALLAWELNGEPIPLAHGGPLRIVIPGYYGINNVKYVKRLAFTIDQSPASIQRTGYRVRPIGMKGAPTQPTMWEMNLKSFITHPAGDAPLRPGVVQLHGVAFSGGSGVQAVEVSVDGGRTWWQAPFFGPYLGRHAWRQFATPVRLERGSHVLASRAIGTDGGVQPEMRLENERGYGHNGWRDHAVKVTVA
jgi:DMSO/TMAO reductase YedYZ molybdopterin-dependent catalytic subunit